MTGTDPRGKNRGPGVLRALGVSRSFQGVVALRDVSLEIHRHEVVGLIGPNGAGKSTLVNILTGFDVPDRGRIELEGTDITAWAAHRRARAGLARTFQHGHSFPRLSVRENVEVAAMGVGADPVEAAERADRLLALLDLGEVGHLPASSLPDGEQRKLGVARALATRPRYLLLDEPAAGLSEVEVPDFIEVLQSVRDDHQAGVLLIDHNVSLIMSACDRIHVLDQGRSIAEGTPEQIGQDPAVATAYLGSTRA